MVEGLNSDPQEDHLRDPPTGSPAIVRESDNGLLALAAHGRMSTDKLTLDTSVIYEYLENQGKASVTERLLQLGAAGEVELVVTARINEDVPQSPLADRIQELPLLNVDVTGSVTRLDCWVIGRDMLGSDEFKSVFSELYRSGKKQPDWRDWDHLHAHFLLGRDVFLTWDNKILNLSGELRTRLGIVVMRPEEYLTVRNQNQGSQAPTNRENAS